MQEESTVNLAPDTQGPQADFSPAAAAADATASTERDERRAEVAARVSSIQDENLRRIFELLIND